MRKVALVGSAEVTRHMAPLHDPSWEIWAMPWDTLPRVDRYFEPHGYWRTEAGPYGSAEEYGDYLRSCTTPIYMRQVEPDVPASVAYPLNSVFELIRCKYLESTIGYMLGLAILEGVDRIGVFGVDMANDEEYAYQKPNCEYLIGFARGRGINVFVPEECALLKSTWRAGVYGVATE